MAQTIHFITNLFSEFGGKALFEWGRQMFDSAKKDAKEFKAVLEKAQSRLTQVFLELGDLENNKLFQLHKKATMGELKDSNGIKISDDNIVYLLGQLKPESLKSTVRALNKLDEETILQFIELWHNYSNWEKFKLLAKKSWSACIAFVENSGIKEKIYFFFKELKEKSKAAEAELDAEIAESINRIKKIKF